jgi:hypothetical protein
VKGILLFLMKDLELLEVFAEAAAVVRLMVVLVVAEQE